MKINLEPTGERAIEDAYRGSLGAYTIYAMHGASYRFVQDLCADKCVLDLGCGSGYGSHRIAAVAREVQGVDVAADAVAYAQQKYRHPGLSFRQIIAGQPLPFADGYFDVVLSFQVIEHVHDDNAVFDGPKQRITSIPTSTAIGYGFDKKDFQISPSASNAMNLIVVAKRS